MDHGAETPASIGALEGGVGSRVAGPSRVAFEVPAAELPVACTLPAILELLTRCKPAVVASATRGPDLSGISGFFAGLLYYFSPPELSAPGPSETAIELPFRLILSPDEEAGFAHAADPATAPGTSGLELWHSRLGLAPGEEGDEGGRGSSRRARDLDAAGRRPAVVADRAQVGRRQRGRRPRAVPAQPDEPAQPLGHRPPLRQPQLRAADRERVLRQPGEGSAAGAQLAGRLAALARRLGAAEGDHPAGRVDPPRDPGARPLRPHRRGRAFCSRSATSRR